MFKYLPWFQYTVTEPLIENGFTFESDRFICRVDAPILILHAEDDHVVPIKLGKKVSLKYNSVIGRNYCKKTCQTTK